MSGEIERTSRAFYARKRDRVARAIAEWKAMRPPELVPVEVHVDGEPVATIAPVVGVALLSAEDEAT